MSASAAACPICGRPRSERHRPFCSPRCADVDLQRWLAGTYVLPAGDDDPDIRHDDDADEIAGQGTGRQL